MSRETLADIKRHISDEITRMHGSSNDSISRLFYDFKTEVVKEIAILQHQGEQIIKHQKTTNGRVNRNEKELESINEQLHGVCTAQDIEEVRKENKKTFWLTMKIVAVGFLIGSFLWIKESRDFIISILFKIF